MRVIPLALALVLAACEQKAPEVVPPASSVDHGEAPDPETDPLGARIHAIGLARVERYEPSEVIHRGRLRRGQARAHPEVLAGTYCYVVVAVSDDSLTELSVTVVDPGGAPLLQSPERGREVTVGLRDALCPVEPGVYQVRARSYAGDGEYAIRLYRQQAM